MKVIKRAALLLVSAPLFTVFAAQGQYANKPLRMILPFPPGGGSDAFSRIFAPKLAEVLGQPVVIDNRPGGGANIGAEIAAKMPADGYTLFLGNVAHAINASLYSKLNYDLVRDFAPVSLLATTPNMLVVHPSVPAKTVKELIALAKVRPGQLDVASSGAGSSAHLASELFSSMAGTRMNHVPYKGGGPAVVALVGGQVSVGFATTPSVIQHVKSGRMRGLAVTSAQRSPSAPELPTISEAALPGYEAGTWYGLMVPTGTPEQIIARLHVESNKLLMVAEVKGRLNAAGFDLIGTTPEQLRAYVRSEIDKWAKVVKSAGVRVD